MIGGLYEEGADSPRLMRFVSADPIKQLHGDAVMEQLTSDFQMRDCFRPTGPEAIHRVCHGSLLLFPCAWVAVFHAQAESTSCTARSQPYIVVQPADSIVRAACTTLGMRGITGKRGTKSPIACILSDSFIGPRRMGRSDAGG
jgi:hypothetical protein